MANPINSFTAVLAKCQTILQQCLVSLNSAALSASEAAASAEGIAGLAPINSPSFTGTPRAITPAVANNSTQLATTAYLDRLLAQPNGVATLDATGVLSIAQLPPLALTTVFVVNSQAAMLALAATVGNIAVRTDTSETYILSALPPSTLGNWTELLFAAPVTSVAGLTGAITGSALNAALAAFTGDSGAGGVKGLVPAPAAGDAAAGKVLGAGGGYVVKANLASPAFTGTPTTTTATTDDNTGQIANTSWFMGQAGSSNPVMDGAAAPGTAVRWARNDHVHPIDTSRAPLASPALTGTPAAPTASPGTNTTQLATCAFVAAAVVAATAGVTSWNSRTGNVVPASGDYAVADVTGAAPLASPAFTGNPTAATQSAGNNSTRLATTAYADAAAGQAAIPSGTIMLFRQTAAPSGWTKLTSTNDAGIRVVSGSVSAVTGATAFSTVFSQTATGNVNLTAAQQANMSVSATGTSSGTYSGSSSTQLKGSTGDSGGDSAVLSTVSSGVVADQGTITLPGSSSGSFSGSAAVSGTASGGGATGNAHAHSVALNLNYIDVILASKN